MSAREIIELAMNNSGLDNVQEQDAQDVIEALTAAGYRIVPPGGFDRNTLEEAAKVAEAAEMRVLDDSGGMKPIWGRHLIAKAIRALGEDGR